MTNPCSRRSKILIVDDEAEVVELLSLILEEDGYRAVRSTTDPFDAARLFQEFEPDLVVLDLHMPRLSGLLVLAQLRALIPAETNLPILVVTGDPKIETRSQVLRAGASDFVTKPYDPNEILARVANLLETRSLHLQLAAKQGELRAFVGNLTDSNAALRGEVATRERVEQALRESEEHLRFALDATEIGQWELNVETGATRNSLRHDQIFGYESPQSDWSAEIFLEKHIHPDDRARVEAILKNIPKPGDGWEFECRIFRVDGEERFIWVRGAVRQGATPREMSGLIMDITPRKRAEKELRLRAAQAAVVAALGERALLHHGLPALFNDAVALVAETIGVQFSKIFELLPDGQSLLLRAGVGWKEGWVRQGRVSEGKNSQAGHALLTRHPVMVEDWRSEKRFSEPPFVREHGIMSGISVMIGREGRPFGVLAADSTSPRFFTTDHIHFLQAISNLLAGAVERSLIEETLREAKDTAERANAIKSEFLSRASHELRTPMSHVLGFAQLLETDTLDPEQQENVQQILLSGRQLMQLIDRILAVAKSDLDDPDILGTGRNESTGQPDFFLATSNRL